MPPLGAPPPIPPPLLLFPAFPATFTESFAVVLTAAPPAAPIPTVLIIGAAEEVSVTAPCDFRMIIVPFAWGFVKVRLAVPVIEIDV